MKKINSIKLTPIGKLLEPFPGGKILHHGWSPQCEKEPSKDEEHWGVLKTTAVQPGKYLEEHNKALPKSLKARPNLEVQEGDLLMTCAGPRSRCGIPCLVRKTRKKLILSGKMYRFRAKISLVEPRYLEAFLLSPGAQAKIDKMKTGISDSGLNLTHSRFLKLEVPMIGLDEQKRVLDSMDENFADIAAGETVLMRVRSNLKRYRASLLKAACEGRLIETEEELSNSNELKYENASELLARVLKSREKNWTKKGHYSKPKYFNQENFGKIPKGWTQTSIDTLVKEPLRNGHSAKEINSNIGPRVFTLTAVTQNDFSEKNTKVTAATSKKIQDLWAEPGDIFVQRSNAPNLVGTARMYRGPRKFAFIPDLYIRVRISSEVSADFIELCFQSERGRNYFKSHAQGISGSMPKIDQETIEMMPILLPPFSEQKRIVQEVNARTEWLDQSERAVNSALKRSQNIKQAILEQVFGAVQSANSKY